MSENTPTPPEQKALKPIDRTKALFGKEEVTKKFEAMLGKKAQGFITSVLQIVSQSDKLINADPKSIYNAAAVAATMDLPLNVNLGFAYIVPYKNKQPDGSFKTVAQFQMGYKGFIQLAQRSGQFKTLNSTDVRMGEIVSHDRLTDEIKFAWVEDQEERLKLPVIAYVAFFKLINGFEKTHLMYVPEIRQHGKKYSKTFGQEYGLWNTDFDNMARKTVTKLLLSKAAPLSIEMQLNTALRVDQAVLLDDSGTDVDYVDVEHTEIDKEAERKTLMIQDADSLEALEAIWEQVGESATEDQLDLYLTKKSILTPSMVTPADLDAMMPGMETKSSTKKSK